MDIVLWVVVIAVMVGFFVLVNRKGMTAESKRKVSRWFFIGMVVVLAVFAVIALVNRFVWATEHRAR